MKNRKLIRLSILALVVLATAVFGYGQEDCVNYPNAPGCVDTTFSGTGTTIWQPPGGGVFQFDSAIQHINGTDKNVIGFCYPCPGLVTQPRGVFVIRLNDDGTIDNTFNNNFGQFVQSSNGFYLRKVLVQYPTPQNGEFNQKIFLLGQAIFLKKGNGYNSGIGITKLNWDGTLDLSFGGGDGTVIIPWTPGFQDAALQSDGRILVVAGSPNFEVTRLNPDGTVDTSFGTGGVVTVTNTIRNQISIGGGPNTISIQNVFGEERIVMVGRRPWGKYNPTYDLVMIRLDPTGALDSTFGVNGKVIDTNFDTGCYHVVSGDKILVAGTYFPTQIYSADSPRGGIIARYDTYGNPDGTFGQGGFVRTGADNRIEFYNVEIDNWGRVIAYGSSGQSGFILGRYQPNGVPDLGFGTGGFVQSDFLSPCCGQIVTQTDGKVVGMARAKADNNVFYLKIARFLP